MSIAPRDLPLRNDPPLNEAVIDYYTDTGMDYRTWSPNFNMHFGYWRAGLSMWRREPMLEEMSRQTLAALGLAPGPATVLDLGCGLGATMRTLAAGDPEKTVIGWTVVPWQVEQAALLNAPYPNIEVRRGSYLALPLPESFADAAYALESSCYAPGEDKAGFLSEMARVLKPGAPFAIADGFTTGDPACRPRLFSTFLEWSREGWALPGFAHLPAVLDGLHRLGFEDLRVRDISWRIAPTVLQSPPSVLLFALKKWLEGEPLNEVRWKHLRACLVSLGVGAYRRQFGYFLISGRRGP